MDRLYYHGNLYCLYLEHWICTPIPDADQQRFFSFKSLHSRVGDRLGGFLSANLGLLELVGLTAVS